MFKISETGKYAYLVEGKRPYSPHYHFTCILTKWDDGKAELYVGGKRQTDPSFQIELTPEQIKKVEDKFDFS